MTEVRTISEYYEKIGVELIKNHPLLSTLKAYLDAGLIKITYLESSKIKRNQLGLVYADCEKVADSKRWAIDADFVITVYSINAGGMTEEQKKILILHELMHAGVDITKKGEVRKFIIPHSIQDFDYIIKTYGMNWCNDGQLEFNFEEEN